MTSAPVRLALFAVVLGASVTGSARPMVDVAAPAAPVAVSTLCLRGRPWEARGPEPT